MDVGECPTHILQSAGERGSLPLDVACAVGIHLYHFCRPTPTLRVLVCRLSEEFNFHACLKILGLGALAGLGGGRLLHAPDGGFLNAGLSGYLPDSVPAPAEAVWTRV